MTQGNNKGESQSPIKLLAIDPQPGITGSMALFENGKLQHYFKMPTYDRIVKEKLLQFDLLNGKKQYIKSGPNKGCVKMKVRRPATTKKELAVNAIVGYMREVDHVVIELQNPRPGNSAQASFTTGVNFGKLLACSGVSDTPTTFVTPAAWKTEMHVTMSPDEKKALGNDSKLIKETLKAKSVSLARSLSGFDFVNSRGTVDHDSAEAALIGYYFINNKDKS